MTKRTTAVQFSDDEIRAMQDAARAVWQYVAGDVLAAVGEETGAGESATISRAEVIELALDADRMTDELRRRRKHDERRTGGSLVTDDLLARIDRADYAQLIKVVKPAFPFTRYGF